MFSIIYVEVCGGTLCMCTYVPGCVEDGGGPRVCVCVYICACVCGGGGASKHNLK